MSLSGARYIFAVLYSDTLSALCIERVFLLLFCVCVCVCVCVYVCVCQRALTHWCTDPASDELNHSLILFFLIQRKSCRCIFLQESSKETDNELLIMNYRRNPDQFRFLRTACLANLKGSVGLILAKASDMRISIPLHLSSRSFIPLPCFIRSRRPIPFLFCCK
jgi:hypothetical protein